MPEDKPMPPTSTPDIPCCECGKPGTPENMIPFRDEWVCPDCKGPFFQRLREGVTSGRSGVAADALAVDGPAVPGFWQSVLLTVGFWVVALICGIVLGVILGVLGAAGLELDRTTMKTASTFLGGMLNLIAFAVVLAVGLVWARRPLPTILPLCKFDLRLLLPLVLLSVGGSLLLSEADNLLQYFLPMPMFLKKMLAEMVGNGWASFFVLVIVAPLTEELFFRGLVLDGLRRRYPKRRAILLSAVLFAVFHLNPYQFLGAFVLGIIMAWLRLETGSLWPCMFVHALNNGLVFFSVALGIDIPGYSTLPADGGHFQGLGLDSLGLLLVVIGGGLTWLLLRLRHTPREAASPDKPNSDNE